VNGYNGTRNGFSVSGFCRRRKKSEIPVSRKNSQKAGAVYATMVSKPSGVCDASSTSAMATAPCTRRALTGALAPSRQMPRTRNIR